MYNFEVPIPEYCTTKENMILVSHDKEVLIKQRRYGQSTWVVVYFYYDPIYLHRKCQSNKPQSNVLMSTVSWYPFSRSGLPLIGQFPISLLVITNPFSCNNLKLSVKKIAKRKENHFVILKQKNLWFALSWNLIYYYGQVKINIKFFFRQLHLNLFGILIKSDFL